jgi:hypothetical protein
MVGSKNFITQIVFGLQRCIKYRLFLGDNRIIIAGIKQYKNIFPTITFTCCWSLNCGAQATLPGRKDTVKRSSQDSATLQNQRDLIDLAMIVVHLDPDKRVSNMSVNSRTWRLSCSPILEYTVATGLTTGLAAGGAFLNGGRDSTNVSSFVGAVKFTQRRQFLLPIESSVWTAGNTWNFPGDWRYLNYPQDTYGIGGHTTQAGDYIVNYKYIRFYEYALKNIGRHWYAGAGYQLDHHWNISEQNLPTGTVTDYRVYGFSPRSTSSGLALDVQYDSRKNSVNPEGGSFYANFSFLQNFRFLGSNSLWNSVQIDVRKYFSIGTTTVLAFWLYSVLGLSGHAPYLDLPGTGTDTYNNTGRGYEEDRYIGKRYVDLEAEYRFGITRNGLLGAVIFCNAGTVSDFDSNRFEVIFPGFGAGMRIKFNKISNTNACLDYGFGTRGSRGFFGNLVEVF